MSEENKQTTKPWIIKAVRRFTIAELIKNRGKPLLFNPAEGTPYPALKPLEGDKWELLADWNCAYNDHEWTVPKGFITDGASIPRILWPLYGSPMEYPYPLSATLHDYLYTIGPKLDPDKWGDTRKEADEVFRDYNIQLGMSKFKAYTEYWALRLCGGTHWGEEEEEEAKEESK